MTDLIAKIVVSVLLIGISSIVIMVNMQRTKERNDMRKKRGE